MNPLCAPVLLQLFGDVEETNRGEKLQEHRIVVAGKVEQTKNTATHNEFTFTQYMKKPYKYFQYQDIKKGFRGFLDILYLQKRHLWGLGVKI